MVRILLVVRKLVLIMNSLGCSTVVNVSVVIAMENLLISIPYLMTRSAITEKERSLVVHGLTLYSATMNTLQHKLNLNPLNTPTLVATETMVLET